MQKRTLPCNLEINNHAMFLLPRLTCLLVWAEGRGLFVFSTI